MKTWKRFKRKLRKKRRKFERRSILEQFEERRVLTSLFTNPFNEFDVNDDGAKSSIDVLQVINRLNLNGPGELPSSSQGNPPPFVDVSGDGNLAPNDALLGINELNRGPQGLVVALFEGGDFSLSESRPIDVGASTGSRQLGFEIKTRFDTSDATGIEDTFNVYITDPATGDTLLDHGAAGTAVFSLSGDQAEFTAGLVRYSGATVEIDTSKLDPERDARLVFQLLSRSGDSRTRVAVSEITNVVDPLGAPRNAFPTQHTTSEVGNSINIAAGDDLPEADVEISNPRFDAGNLFATDLRVKNNGQDVGRDLAVVVSNLPEGLTVANQSGVTENGQPYLNIREAVANGGLRTGDRTDHVTLEIANPANRLFPLDLSVVSLGSNRAPALQPVDPLSVLPGDQVSVELQVSDADGDQVKLSIRGAEGTLPPLLLTGDKRLVVTPRPEDVGSYAFDVVATDGVLEMVQTITVEVPADPITSTRVSGVVQNTEQLPLEGIRLSLGSADTTTDADGSFTLDLGAVGVGPEDALLIHGTELTGEESYPFIAERLKLLVDDGPFNGVNNVVQRPIFLPALDTASEVAINPGQDTTVDSDTLTGASLFVGAGTLRNRDGTDYQGSLGITEVPRELTPAALPDGVIPDTVVTIQPGELEFSVPAPLTLPNRGGLEPGTLLDLLSIDPVVGDFGLAGIGRVSADGRLIETISGGVTSSSWHVFTVPVESNGPNAAGNQNQRGKERAQKAKASSDVETHSGVLLENHNLVTYESLGETRGITLVYDSHRADPRHILHQTATIFGFFVPGTRAAARATIRRGTVEFEVPGGSVPGLNGNEHFWKLPASERGDMDLALLADLSDQPSGVYDADLSSGTVILAADGSATVGSFSETAVQFINVNSIASPLGAGWGIAGLQQLVANPDGSVLLIDGDGSELVFDPPASAGAPFQSPPGEVTELMQEADGTFQRTHRNQTVERYNANHQLESVIDRNGNELRYEYDDQQRLVRMIDPVGLETTFSYTGGLLTEIQDPAARVTSFEHDQRGNLIRIVDPDGSTRTFGYDSRHHLLSEVDKRGNFEESFYNFAGRVTRTQQKDGNLLHFDSPQLQGLFPATDTVDPTDPPTAVVIEENVAVSTFADGNGNIITTELDQRGQVVALSDLEGPLPRFVRDDDNQIISTIDARGNVTQLSYDDRGNLVRQQDGAGGSRGPRPVFESPSGQLFGTRFTRTHTSEQTTIGDLNNDGVDDVAVVAPDHNLAAVRLAVGDGTLMEQQEFEVGNVPEHIVAVDLDSDENLDLVTANRGSISVLLGNGDGTFAERTDLTASSNIWALAAVDATGDSVPDLVLARGDRFEVVEVGVMVGDGSGRFAAPVFQEVFSGDHFVDRNLMTTADLNNDGLVDVGLHMHNPLGRETSLFKLLVSNGDGSFTESQDVRETGFMHFTQLADVNDDGFADLVHGIDDQIFVRRGSGTGTVGPRQEVLNIGFDLAFPGLKVTDVDRDGTQDILMSIHFGLDPGFAVAYGSGGLRFSDPLFVPTDEARGLFATDLTSDGQPDIVVTSFAARDGIIAVVPAVDRRQFAEPTRLGLGPTAVAGRAQGIDAGDLNSDGIPDVVATTTAGTALLLSSGTLNFAPAEQLEGSGGMIRLEDLNNDGNLDLITSGDSNQNFSNRLGVRLGNGDGSFGDRDLYDVGSSAHNSGGHFYVGDFNNDAVSDVVVSKQASVVLLLGNGDGTLADPIETELEDRNFLGNSIVGGDFDADGNQDVAVLSSMTGVLGLFGDGAGGFSMQTISDLGGGSLAGSAEAIGGDFDNDGDTDIVVVRPIGTTGDHVMSVILAGAGRQADQVVEMPVNNLSGGEAIGAGDLDEDGDIDLVLTNSSFNAFTLFSNDGSGNFDDTAKFYSGEQPTGFAFGDFDDNGVLDVVSTNATNRFIDGYLAITLRGELNNLGCEGACATEFTYDPIFGLPTSLVDEVGSTTLFDYDPNNGNLLTVTRVNGVLDAERTTSPDPDDPVTTHTYTDRGQLETVTDPLGRITRFTYDALGRFTTATEAVGTATEANRHTEYDAAGNITATVDENGNRVELEYDALNRVTIARDAFGEATLFEYDAAGNLVAETDARGNVTRFEYDAFDRILRTIDPLGGVTSNEYDGAGNLVAFTDELGQTARSEFDARNRLTRLIDRAGGVTEFRYDADDNLVERIDALGNTISFEYDSRSRVVTETDQLGGVSHTVYGGDDQLLAVTDERGNVRAFEYDDLGGLVRETDALGHTELTSYDLAGNVVSETDQLGRETQYEYDDRNRRTTETDPAGGVLQFEFDAVGNLVSTTDELGRISQFTYDASNRMLSATDPGDNTARFQYDEVGNLVTTTDANGDSTRYVYDELNRAVKSIDPLGGEIVTTYNATGQVASVQDEFGRTTTYEYDVLSRMIAETDSLGNTLAREFDALSRVTAEIDSLGNRQVTEYDALSRITRVTDPAGNTTSRTYDAASNLTAVEDAVGNVTRFEYDELDRLVKRVDPLGAAEVYAYDAEFNRISTVDRLGREVRVVYDLLDRPVEELWLDEDQTTVNTITRSYDAADQLLTIEDENSSYSYTYDRTGEISSVSNSGTPNVPEVRFSFEYDAIGNNTHIQESIDGQESAATDRFFDELGRLTSIQQSGADTSAKRVDFAYNPAGQVTEISRFADLDRAAPVVSSRYTYDTAGRIEQLAHNNGVPISVYDLTYDDADRLVELQSSVDGVSSFSYDEAGRLLESRSDAEGEEFSYDGTGNRLAEEVVTGTNNRLLDDGVHDYEYDDAGNRIRRTNRLTDASTEYEWDHLNRLTRVVERNGDGTIVRDSQYTYDVFGRRIVKSVDADGAGPLAAEVTHFVYEGTDLVLVFDAAGNRLARNLFGPRVDFALAEEGPTGEVRWNLQDVRNNVVDVVSDTGEVLNHLTYSSFGTIVGQSDPSAAPRFTYAGREVDSETGLIYMRARYLDPATGQFISEDPLGFGGGDANLYAYVFNSPISFGDPFGTDAVAHVLQGANAFFGGLASSFTFGATDRIREKIDPVTTKKARESGLYTAGQYTGDVIQIAAGAGVKKGLSNVNKLRKQVRAANNQIKKSVKKSAKKQGNKARQKARNKFRRNQRKKVQAKERKIRNVQRNQRAFNANLAINGGGAGFNLAFKAFGLNPCQPLNVFDFVNPVLVFIGFRFANRPVVNQIDDIRDNIRNKNFERALFRKEVQDVKKAVQQRAAQQQAAVQQKLDKVDDIFERLARQKGFANEAAENAFIKAENQLLGAFGKKDKDFGDALKKIAIKDEGVGAGLKQAADTPVELRPPIEQVRAALNNIPIPNGSDEIKDAVNHLRNGTQPTPDFIRGGDSGGFQLPSL